MAEENVTINVDPEQPDQKLKKEKVDRIVFLSGIISASLGSSIFLLITIIGAATYGEVYYFNGYTYTAVLCGFSIGFLLIGLIASVFFLIRNKAIIKEKFFLKKLIITLVAIVLCISFSSTLFAFADGHSTKSRSSSASSSYSSSSYSSGNSGYEMDADLYAMLYLKISNVKVSQGSLYTYCTGTIKNTGSYIIRYVKVRGAFQNYAGTTLDTAWTYAIGSEGLGSGESTTFKMSVTKNTSITNCSVTIL